MELSPEQIAAFRAHLARVGVGERPPCLLCDSQDLAAPYLLAGTPPIVAYHCRTCGFLAQFDAATIGVELPPMTITSADGALSLRPAAEAGPSLATEETLREIRDLLRRHTGPLGG